MTALRKNPEAFIETEVDGEIVLIALETNEFLALRDTAVAVWRALDARPNRKQLVEALCESHDAPRERIEADVAPFLQELETLHILEVSG